MASPFYSIDQNSHSLWDVVPKLQALTLQGLAGTHFIEDIDVAFTRRAPAPGQTPPLELLPEQYYRDGVSDWGAALFYTHFLGRNPLQLRQLEPLTGLTSRALARILELTVDQLYQRYSVSDNWQMVGSSYLFDQYSHRVIGDLTTREVAPLVMRLIDLARWNLTHAFPGRESRRNLDSWFETESGRVEKLAGQHAESSLSNFYRSWLRHHLGRKVAYSLTSKLFAASAAIPPSPLFAAFLADYEKMTAAYNAALRESGEVLNPLHTSVGELPFFAVWRRHGRMFRTPLALRDHSLVCGAEAWELGRKRQAPLEIMRGKGLVAIVGKALIMVLEARRRDGGAPLAMPEHGSLYMPAAHALQRHLQRLGIVAAETFPLLRVKFNFLQHLRRRTGTPVRPPAYIAGRLGQQNIDLAKLGELLPQLQRQACRELKDAHSADGREKLAARLNPARTAELKKLQARRRELAQDPETRPQAAELWDRAKQLEKRQWQDLVARLVDNLHLSRLDYWNSRGALLPWSIAAGGREFYQSVIEQAEIAEETAWT